MSETSTEWPQMAPEPKAFLFRFDGAPENNAFLEQAQKQGHVVYAGIEMQVNYGWIPDFLEVRFNKDQSTYDFLIVELEARASTARISARKYLPESSQELIKSFGRYLARVVERCRATADPRAEAIGQLREALTSPSSTVRVWTVGATRQPPQEVERLALIDQGALSIPRGEGTPIQVQAAGSLAGEIKASARYHQALSRSILILDAVVRGWDKSDATLRAWRNLRSQPLKRYIAEMPNKYPALSTLLMGAKTGAKIQIDLAADEVSTIWNQSEPGRHTKDTVISALQRFLPIDRTLDVNAPVRIAFERAQEILRG